MKGTSFGFGGVAVFVAAAWTLAAAADIPRTANGKPDFSGYYDTATTTPLERRSGEATLSADAADAIAKRTAAGLAAGSRDLAPDRGAPPVGGDGSRGAAGNVGGYDSFWVDPGERHTVVDGEYRASIVTEPANGRLPPRTDDAQARRAERFRSAQGRPRQNDGTAWWGAEPGPFDDPEQRPYAERCLIGFGSTAGPPMLPTLYNNHKRIVQTPDHVMILTEMVHDARIVRMNGEHAPDNVRRWIGDSIGWWEGDTLVVETTNFTDRPALGWGTTRNLRVVERFTRVDAKTTLYNFTVEDPAVWEVPWTGEYTWPQTDEPVYEYACHEGNYAMGNILCGARRMEAEAAGPEALAAFANTSCGARVATMASLAPEAGE